MSAPTLKLLNSASLVGFSGGLRLYLAFFLADIVPDFLLIIASSSIIYATYTLDRALDNKEDEINHQEFSGANKKFGLAVCGIAILIGVVIFFSKLQFSPPLFPFFVGILYSRGLSIGKREIKLKGGSGIKNIVIGVTWGGTIGLVIASTGQIIAAMAICFYFGLKLFINSTIYDLKDVKGDLAAGILTLPVILGERNLKYLLFSLCIIQHSVLLLAMTGGILTYSEIFFLGSVFLTGTVILGYTSAFESAQLWILRKFRVIMIDGESMILVLLSIFLPY